MNRKTLPITALILFCLPLITTKTYAHNPGYVINATYGITPTIDGAISPTEWTDASFVQFNYTTAYLKQDGKSLYIAFNVTDNTVIADKEGVLAFIDTAHDGGTEPQNDDIAFIVFRNGTALEMHAQGTVIPPDSNWTVAVNEATNTYTAEFNITYPKIGVTPGTNQTLGLMLNSYDHMTPIGKNYYWPPLTENEAFKPSNWGDLTSDVDWIPEYQTLTAITTLTIVTLTTAIIRKKSTHLKLRTHRKRD